MRWSDAGKMSSVACCSLGRSSLDLPPLCQQRCVGGGDELVTDELVFQRTVVCKNSHLTSQVPITYESPGNLKQDSADR